MFPIVVYFVSILQAVILVHASGHYTVVAPGTIRPNYKYNVAISVHGGPCEIIVGITGPSYKETKTINMVPMSTQTVEFDVPKLEIGDYNLTAVGISGIIFENATKINFGENNPCIFIQTDKATYKPGDLVQYRILFLDAHTKPAEIVKDISIHINDGAQNRIKQIKEVTPTKGVYNSKFQLSEQPVLGSWTIDVLLDDERAESKSFEVDKYVLPKFEVTIETAKDVAISDGVIKVTVRSKYTYGKSVKGKATVSIKPTYHYYGSEAVMESQKTVDIDGKGHIEFDLKRDLSISSDRNYVPPLIILAIMEEELTGNKQNTTASVTLHIERYRIEGIETPYTYYPRKPVTFTVMIKHLDNSPVQDTKNKAKLIVEPPRNYFSRGIVRDSISSTPPITEDGTPLEIESPLNEHGIAKFELTLPDSNHTFYTIKCKFIDSTAYLSSLSKFEPQVVDTPELLKITVNTKKPQIGSNLSINVGSSESIPYFIYVIVARGNILLTEYVQVPEGRKSHNIKITPTFEMVPRTTIFAYYIFNNDLRFAEKEIDFEKNFLNTIDITSSVQAKPGENITFKIKTDPESFVGLLGVDQSVLLLKSGNDFSKESIFSSLRNFESSTPWQHGFGRYPGQTAGVITLTNANYPYNDDILKTQAEGEDISYDDEESSIDRLDSSSTETATKELASLFKVRRDFSETWIYFNQNRPLYSIASTGVAFESINGGIMPDGVVNRPIVSREQEIIRIRKEFPENWIFDYTENAEGGELVFSKKVPDTITSWVITAFALSPKTGIALTENPTKIQVFQPFFVSTNLPYSVKRGEVISVPVVIFNYMEKALDVEVTMDNTDKEYEFTEATNEVDDTAIIEVKRTKRTTVLSNTGKVLSFMIRPKILGAVTLKITAVTPLAGDVIHQTLKVEPEGVIQYENRAIFVNLKDQTEQTGEINVDIPSEIVIDSEYIEFSTVGDMLGPTIKNLDKLVRMPYGCGEQNMVNFVPNILVLKYLNTISQSKPTITEKATKFLEIGYQRELTYKHDDGSYSAFGKSDKEGSTWLTAYVVRSFHQAAKYTDIDPKIIVEGLDFLASKQAANGSFPEYGKLFDSAHHNELGLTSFVLLAFFENNEHIEKYQAQIENGLMFVMNNIDNLDDQYGLSIAVIALQKANNPITEKVLANLNAVAKKENDRKWWSREPDTKLDEPAWYWRPRSNDVEITSYILLAILEKQSTDGVLPIIKWLISQRNSNGGFASTQDTVVGLEALIKFAEKAGSGNGEMAIDFTSKGGIENKGTINVNPENSLVLQTQVLPKSTRQLNFVAKGTGSAIVQVSYRFNLAVRDKKPSFQVKIAIKDNSPPAQLVMDVCAEFVPFDGVNQDKIESNMAVMEVALPSGYTADIDSFGKIEAIDSVKRTELKNSDSTVIIYFDSLAKGVVKCVPIEATKTHSVAKQKPVAVLLYDYYNTERSATEYYEVKSSLCDICADEDCGQGCKKQ